MPELQKDNRAVTLTRDAIADSLEFPSDKPTWKWLEENVELSAVESDLSGKIKFDLFPASKIFFNYLDNPRLRKATAMKCSQSAFTQNAIGYVLRRIKERPVTTMWIGATAAKTEEDAKKRFWPAIKSCPAVEKIAPADIDKERWTKRLIMFDTMSLLIRGANSIGGLRGDPVGLIICDERADWKPGRIYKARQRTTTKQAPVEISIGAAGVKGDELHADWKEGSQTFIHFLCPACQHSQPFRFSKKETVLFPEKRQLGGLVFDESESTGSSGKWNYDEVEKATRYECEKCGKRFHNVEKLELLRTAHEVHRNPSALPEKFSLHVSALVLVWQERAWGKIMVEFLKAVEEMRTGNIEPMISFVTETLGEPWELRNEKQKESELLDRCGSYKMGELWPDDPKNPAALILTFDRQQWNIPYVVRQWRRNGDSRLVWCGAFPSYDELREFQQLHKIKDRCVWGDDGGKMAAEFRQTCLRYGWSTMKGEDWKSYSVGEGENKVRQGYRQTEFDPGIGTSQAGRVKMRAWLWSKPWFTDKLKNIFMLGRGPLWELPSDIPLDYIKQVSASEWRETELSNGQIKGYWHTVGADHFEDCEKEQLVVADCGGLTRTLRAN